ncbi:NAD(P)/FAD-dependent oxidoreductase [Qipengyuania atrilutea]|uniref:FAD-binding oxidoreductase n=1 Tax=Qipengyuania atrilutea TaxID=2744473 RepID=A0A850H497_9SPHN|nr:FAD-dependent oxidoreductase [Actirhodobacter atriluteus]NVD45466.1 FAD-binding oxidoreductase [Actirhodobacter atriluteus]
MSDTIYDFAVVGAGIAGASIASELAGSGSTVMLEAEDRPGYHATGRSAAFWEECYGGPEITPLTLASGPFLRENSFLSPRGALYIGRDADEVALDRFEERFGPTDATFRRLGRTELADRIAGLRAEWTGGIWQPDCADIDVAALHEAYLKGAKAGRAALKTRFRLARAHRTGGVWELFSEAGETVRAAVLVNAAGAWADRVGELAGARPKGIVPLRRTVVQLRTDPAPPRDQPLVLDISGKFYFKPESGKLWLSPHDETPSEACDAAPEELDVALAIERLKDVLEVHLEGVERRWAGLRSFTADRLPVFGPDREVEGLFWFAGQGGYGIQTSPASAHVAARMLTGEAATGAYADVDTSPYRAARFP